MFKEEDNYSEKLLVANVDMINADIISSILDSYNIPHIKKSKGTGDLMRIYTGFNFYGVDIYVPSNVYEEAKELIDSQSIEEKTEECEEYEFEDFEEE